MKKTLSVLLVFAFALNVEAVRAQTEGIVAKPVESVTTELPEDGRSMFDRGPRPTPVAPVEQTAPKDAAKTGAQKTVDAKPGEPVAKSTSNADAKTVDELSYEAIWSRFLSGPRSDASLLSDKNSALAPTLTPDETLIKMLALQTAQNTKLIEQNEQLLRQNEQIIVLLKQAAGIKTIGKPK